jgi:hypothetical protein
MGPLYKCGMQTMVPLPSHALFCLQINRRAIACGTSHVEGVQC